MGVDGKVSLQNESTKRLMMSVIERIKKKNLSISVFCQNVGIGESTFWRYVSGDTSPTYKKLESICAELNVPVDELLNGPQQQTFDVTLKYVKTLERVDEEMNMSGISLTIAEDWFVGVSGGKKFESREDVDNVVEVIRKKLTWGFEHRDEMKEEV